MLRPVVESLGQAFREIFPREKSLEERIAERDRFIQHADGILQGINARFLSGEGTIETLVLDDTSYAAVTLKYNGELPSLKLSLKILEDGFIRISNFEWPIASFHSQNIPNFWEKLKATLIKFVEKTYPAQGY